MQTIFNMLPNCYVELIIVVCNFPFNLVYFHKKTPTKAMHRDILCYLERGSVLIAFVIYYNLQIIELSYFMVEFNWKCVSRCYETNRSFQLKHDLAGPLLLETISLSIYPDCQKRTKNVYLYSRWQIHFLLHLCAYVLCEISLEFFYLKCMFRRGLLIFAWKISLEYFLNLCSFWSRFSKIDTCWKYIILYYTPLGISQKKYSKTTFSYNRLKALSAWQ